MCACSAQEVVSTYLMKTILSRDYKHPKTCYASFRLQIANDSAKILYSAFPRHLLVYTNSKLLRVANLSTETSLAKTHLHQLIPVFIISLNKLKSITLLPEFN